MIRSKCGDNYVEASLDKFRACGDIFRVLQASDHHSDDYTAVEPLANSLRSWVKERAKKQGFNILYDGTGIPFEPRYSDLAKEFKQAGFSTTVACVDTMLVTPKGREKECSIPALERIKKRSQSGNDKRMLPFIVVLSKHRNAMDSFLEAVECTYVDKAVAYCNDGPPGRHYVMAETFDRPHLTSADGTKIECLKKILASSHNSMLDLQRVPAVNEDNIALLDRWVGGKPRTLAISNATRMVDMGEKVLLNTHASGPSNLLHPQEDLSFAIPLYGNGDKVRLQRPEKAYSLGVSKMQEEPAVGM